MREDSLDLYLKEVKRYPLLDSDEEKRLAKLALRGNQEARDRLVESNLRFVISVAKKFQNRGLPLIDLIAIGNVGLVIASKKFDPSKGVKFISYAVWWIRQGIQQSLSEQGGPVRVPLNRSSEYKRIGIFQRTYFEKTGISPSTAEIAKALSIPESTVVFLLGAKRSLSLDAPIGRDRSQNETFHSRFSNSGQDEAHQAWEDEEERVKRRRILFEVLEEVKLIEGDVYGERNIEIFCRCFNLLPDGDPEPTLEKVGKRFKITRERARQIRDRVQGRAETIIRSRYPNAVSS